MHLTTAKLISLERAEMFVSKGWPKGALVSLAKQARALRAELPPHILALYDGLKAWKKEVVVAVVDGTCGGCHSAVSQATLAALNESTEVVCCEHCECVIYQAERPPALKTVTPDASDERTP